MFGFFIKKNFCDIWDNFFSVFIPGVIISIISCLCFIATFATGVIYSSRLLLLLVFLISCAIFFGSIMAFSHNAYCLARWDVAPIKNYFRGFGNFFTGCQFGILVGVGIVLVLFSLPYYLKMHNIIGFVIAGLLIGFLCVSILSLQWFFPLYAIMHDSFFKTLKKCYIIFFDNSLFSIAVFLHNIILAIFGVIMFSSYAMVCLSLTNALRLRLYKYDWLEKQNCEDGASHAQEVPWEDLIAQDRATLGNRTLASFIFPWK